MKINDRFPDVSAMPSALPGGPGKAAAWQAQLERAWLESWRGDRPEAAIVPTPGEAQAASAPPGAPSHRSDLVSAPDAAPFGCAGQFNDKHMPAHDQSDHCSSMAEPSGRLLEVPVNDTLHNTGRSGSHLAAAPLRPQVKIAMSGFGLGDAAGPADALMQHRSPLQHAPDAQPVRALLQVAMADGTAQVTLRDATLSSTEAARLPQAIAHQLLESGLASVRLYVNGRVSQHGRRDHGPARQDTRSDIGSTDPLHFNSLERK